MREKKDVSPCSNNHQIINIYPIVTEIKVKVIKILDTIGVLGHVHRIQVLENHLIPGGRLLSLLHGCSRYDHQDRPEQPMNGAI